MDVLTVLAGLVVDASAAAPPLLELLVLFLRFLQLEA